MGLGRQVEHNKTGEAEEPFCGLLGLGREHRLLLRRRRGTVDCNRAIQPSHHKSLTDGGFFRFLISSFF